MNLKTTSSLSPILKSVKENLNVRNLDLLSAALEQKTGESRELFQSEYEDQIKRIIKQLRSLKPLTSGELDLVRKLVVGDAEHYAKLENNFSEWKKELDRLFDELERFQDRSPQGDDLLNFRAIVRDARMLIPAVKFFLECQDRLERFKTMSSDGIDVGEANALAGVLEQQIRSPDV